MLSFFGLASLFNGRNAKAKNVRKACGQVSLGIERLEDRSLMAGLVVNTHHLADQYIGDTGVAAEFQLTGRRVPVSMTFAPDDGTTFEGVEDAVLMADIYSTHARTGRLIKRPDGDEFESLVSRGSVNADGNLVFPISKAYGKILGSRRIELQVHVDVADDAVAGDEIRLDLPQFDFGRLKKGTLRYVGASENPTLTVRRNTADLAASLNGPTSALEGDRMSYHLLVTNNGPNTAKNAVATISLPVGFTYEGAGVVDHATGNIHLSLGDLAPGQARHEEISFTVGHVPAGVLVNGVNVNSDTFDPNYGNNVSANILTTIVNRNEVTMNFAAGSVDTLGTDAIDHVFGRLTVGTTEGEVSVGHLFFSVEATDVDQETLGLPTDELLKDVELWNVMTGQIVAATPVFTEEGFGVYRVSNIVFDDLQVWEVRADIASASADYFLNGDRFRFSVIVQSAVTSQQANIPGFGLTPDFRSQILDRNTQRVAIVRPGGVLSANWNTMVIDDDCGTENLFVTQSTTPVRPQYLLGGALSDTLLEVTYEADGKAIDIMKQFISATGSNVRSIDRLEFYLKNVATPFVTATIAGVGSDSVPATFTTYAANMPNGQLVIPAVGKVTVEVKARMKSDDVGAISGEGIQLNVLGTFDSIRARGVESGNNLLRNDGDGSYEGEVFIGVDVAGPNRDIIGAAHTVVLAKIASVTNANPDADHANVPTGIAPFGQFKFTAAQHSNTLNGLNDVRLEDLWFIVDATNVLMNAADFRVYDKANASASVGCIVTDMNGTVLNGQVTGVFRVKATLSNSIVDNRIDAGTNKTLVLTGNILNPRVNPLGNTLLQAILDGRRSTWGDPDINAIDEVYSGLGLDVDLKGSTLYN